MPEHFAVDQTDRSKKTLEHKKHRSHACRNRCKRPAQKKKLTSGRTRKPLHRINQQCLKIASLLTNYTCHPTNVTHLLSVQPDWSAIMSALPAFKGVLTHGAERRAPATDCEGAWLLTRHTRGRKAWGLLVGRWINWHLRAGIADRRHTRYTSSKRLTLASVWLWDVVCILLS